MISTTLFTTSEGQTKLVVMIMTIVGMLQGEMSWMEGMAVLGGSQAVFTGARTWKKTSEERSEAIKAEAQADTAEASANAAHARANAAEALARAKIGDKS